MTEQDHRKVILPNTRYRHSDVGLSPSQVLKLCLLALICTGMFAVVDWIYEQTESATTAHRATQANRTAVPNPKPTPAPEAERAPSRETPRSSAPDASTGSATAKARAAPAIEGASDTAANRGMSLLAVQTSEAPVTQGIALSSARGTPDPSSKEVAISAAIPASASLVAQGTGASGSQEASDSGLGKCLLPELRTVLADVSARFGAVTIVAAHQLNTANHSSGSLREKLHHDCKALDFRPDRSRIDDIKAYLRSRPEVGGVESYRDGAVHIDVAGTTAASRRPQQPMRPQVERTQLALQVPQGTDVSPRSAFLAHNR